MSLPLTKESQLIEGLFRVVDKQGNDIDFVLNPTQRYVDNHLTGRDLIPKARQMGVSTLMLARYGIACLMQRNTRAVVISHESDATQRMLAKVRYFINNMRGPSPVIASDSANRISFPKMNSEFYIGTAGSRAFGRGDTITHLHCSEYAFWENPDLITGLLESVPATGEVAIESTGNGSGTDYSKRCMRAEAGTSNWNVIFLPWTKEPDYTHFLSVEEEAALMSHLNHDLEEHLLVQVLTPGQISWRRQKLDDHDNDLAKFHAEYPLSLKECFQATGKSVFPSVNYIDSPLWGPHPTIARLKLLSPHPIRGNHYSLGADPSGGVGADRSVIEVYCVETDEQVAEWIHDRTPPEKFAIRIQEVAHLFDNAYITVEANNHGILTLHVLLESDYPEHLLHKQNSGLPKDDLPMLQTYGFRTTERSKPLALGNLRTAVSHDTTIYSLVLNDEMGTYVEDENGKMGAQQGCFDDCVMASAMAIIGLDNAAMISKGHSSPQTEVFDGFNQINMDAVFEELHSRYQGGDGDYPISSYIDGD